MDRYGLMDCSEAFDLHSVVVPCVKFTVDCSGSGFGQIEGTGIEEVPFGQ